MAYIGSACLNVGCRKKIWVVAGPEFGANKGRRVIIAQARYGLESAASSFGEEANLSQCPGSARREAQLNCFVDANYAGNKVTFKSQTGVLIVVN